MFYTSAELAAKLDVNVALIYIWQDSGGGPASIEFMDRTLYTVEAVDAWESGAAMRPRLAS